MTSSVAFLCLMNRRWVMWGGGEIKNCLSCQSKLKRNLIIIPNQHRKDTKSAPPYNGSAGLGQDNYQIISSSDKAWTDPETQHWVGGSAWCSLQTSSFCTDYWKGEQRKNFRGDFGVRLAVGPFQPKWATVWIIPADSEVKIQATMRRPTRFPSLLLQLTIARQKLLLTRPGRAGVESKTALGVVTRSPDQCQGEGKWVWTCHGGKKSIPKKKKLSLNHFSGEKRRPGSCRLWKGCDCSQHKGTGAQVMTECFGRRHPAAAASRFKHLIFARGGCYGDRSIRLAMCFLGRTR